MDEEVSNNDNYDSFLGNESEMVTTRDAPRYDESTFEKRNDPKPLLKRFKLNLLNAYEVEETIEKDGIPYKVKRVKRIPGTKPKANKQGIEDIMRYMESLVNNHTVQANIDTKNDFNIEMKSISFDITVHFIANRENWGITLRDVDILISNAVNLVDLFLTRALYNKEREGYSEGYKEITSKQFGEGKKKNTIEQIGNWFSKR